MSEIIKRVCYKDGTYKDVKASNAWEYENDPDWDKTTEVAVSSLTLAQVQIILAVLFDGAAVEYAWRPMLLAEINSFKTEAIGKAQAILAEAQARGA